MKSQILLLILSVFFGTPSSYSEVVIKTLPAERVLKRLSFQLSGGPPSLEEKFKLSQLSSLEDKEKFLKHQTEVYISSTEFEMVVDRKISDLFYLNPVGPLVPFDPESHIESNSMNLLFRQMAKENLPWTFLFTGKKYFVLSENENNIAIAGDGSFFKFVTPSSINPVSGLIKGREFLELNFSEDDARVSGAFTTERFQRRYITTELNKNRRRAAAAFRIGLCDPMKAAVSVGEGREEELFELVFDHLHEGLPPEELEKRLQEDAHGRDPACMACHYKLDPMGQTFRGLHQSLSPRPWGGALSFTNSRGQKVLVPGRGIGDVMTSMTEQPEFWSCQSDRFSRWIFGQDVYLSQARSKAITNHINDHQLGTKDIFRFLVAQPEFLSLQELSEAQKLGLFAKELLRRCDSCHSNSKLGPPPLSEWPIGGSVGSMKRWVKRLGRVLDLENEGRFAQMPPPSASWRLDGASAKKLKSWIEMGSPDESGTPILGDKK